LEETYNLRGFTPTWATLYISNSVGGDL